MQNKINAQHFKKSYIYLLQNLLKDFDFYMHCLAPDMEEQNRLKADFALQNITSYLSIHEPLLKYGMDDLGVSDDFKKRFADVFNYYKKSPRARLVELKSEYAYDNLKK